MFENHNYIKESIIKIEKDEMSPSEMENNLENHEIFFKHMIPMNPNISYYDIIYILHEKYNIEKIIYK